VCVYNSLYELLKRIQDRWGGVMSAVGQRHARWKPGYALIWTNAKAANLLEAIGPYLRIKSNHAAALLEFQEHVRRCRRTRDSGGRLQRLTKGELIFRENFHDRLKRLNERGVTRGSEGRRRERRLRPKTPLSPRYLAGFIDGEGSLMIARWTSPRYTRVYYKPRISIANTHKEVLQQIQQVYGGILANQPPRKAAWRFAYQLIWTDGIVGPLLSVVKPYLIIKRDQASVLEQLIRSRQRMLQDRKPSAKRSLGIPASVLAEQAELYRKVKHLNRRGPPIGGLSNRQKSSSRPQLYIAR